MSTADGWGAGDGTKGRAISPIAFHVRLISRLNFSTKKILVVFSFFILPVGQPKFMINMGRVNGLFVRLESTVTLENFITGDYPLLIFIE